MQNKMLDKVNDDIDKNIDDIVKLDGKLKALLAKGSICCLWIIILIELAFLIFCIVMMTS